MWARTNHRAKLQSMLPDRFIPTGFRIGYFALAAILVISNSVSFAAETAPSREEIRAAVESGLRTIEKGMVAYREERTCFSCHNHTLPMQALRTARQRGFAVDETVFREQGQLTHNFFQTRTNALRNGKDIGGKSMTVGFGLWALQLGDWASDDTTSAMVEYLLKTQEKDGRFFSTSSRPPLEDSAFTGTAVAAYYLQAFGPQERSDAVKRSVNTARQWMLQAQTKSQEDRNSKLWGLHLLGAGGEEVEKARAAVLENQRADGGWAQLAEMESDAYATGQTLFVLQETGTTVDHPAYQRGVRQLLASRLSDGTWRVKTRSKPIQTYFESGFPHGVDQFISICATSWAVAALAPCSQ
jgi:N-acyl-D-amino-acid deacylase